MRLNIVIYFLALESSPNLLSIFLFLQRPWTTCSRFDEVANIRNMTDVHFIFSLGRCQIQLYKLIEFVAYYCDPEERHFLIIFCLLTNFYWDLAIEKKKLRLHSRYVRTAYMRNTGENLFFFHLLLVITIVYYIDHSSFQGNYTFF